MPERTSADGSGRAHRDPSCFGKVKREMVTRIASLLFHSGHAVKLWALGLWFLLFVSSTLAGCGDSQSDASSPTRTVTLETTFTPSRTPSTTEGVRTPMSMTTNPPITTLPTVAATNSQPSGVSNAAIPTLVPTPDFAVLEIGRAPASVLGTTPIPTDTERAPVSTSGPTSTARGMENSAGLASVSLTVMDAQVSTTPTPTADPLAIDMESSPTPAPTPLHAAIDMESSPTPTPTPLHAAVAMDHAVDSEARQTLPVADIEPLSTAESPQPPANSPAGKLLPTMQEVATLEDYHASRFYPRRVVVIKDVPLRLYISRLHREHINKFTIEPFLDSTNFFPPGTLGVESFTPDQSGEFKMHNVGHGYAGDFIVVNTPAEAKERVARTGLQEFSLIHDLAGGRIVPSRIVVRIGVPVKFYNTSLDGAEEPVSEVKRRPKPPSVDSRFRGNNEILSCITHQCIVLKSEIVMTVLA